MQHVKIHRGYEGNFLDPLDYLSVLPELADHLPAGARTFATDPQHYDFYSQRCVKDLKPLALVFGEENGVGWAELHLGHNCWKHEEDLTIRYVGLRSLVIDPVAADDVTKLLDVILDELLPHEHGCSHELACLAGTLTVTCTDLIATWREADCPER
ncbi:hypothetical protein [Catellatospora sichuanensis]|uniref:hypothetical protein n=1 Tax=Catellatospora sichuanensis TaxID=1969805 RepID=UPI001183BBB4|nr:hypothetical protein [Catellatospora sichuanensis]